MGTHPIFESDFDCLTALDMNRVGTSTRLARRYLRYETTKTHKATHVTRKFILQKLWGQNKLSEKQYFAAQYRWYCMKCTALWFAWSMWLFNDNGTQSLSWSNQTN